MGAHDFERLGSVGNAVLVVLVNQTAVERHGGEGCVGRLCYLGGVLAFDLKEPVLQNDSRDAAGSQPFCDLVAF